jgi:hypothetical protein
MMLTLTTSGISGVIKCLPSALEVYDTEGRGL